MNENTQHTIFLGTGTNLGDRLHNLEQARHLIQKNVGEILNFSSIYFTEAWGITDQAHFYNQVLQVNSSLSPLQVLEAILNIEKEMGRERTQKWGSRLIDIDLLFYGQQIIKIPGLIVPHPFIQERNFVLVPMAEIAADFFHPVFHKTIGELLAASNDPLKCNPIAE